MDEPRICDEQHFETSNLWELVRATAENEQCLNKTLAVFSKPFALQEFNFSTEDNPDSLDILHYFGHSIQTSRFHFSHKKDCDPNETSKRNRFLRYANLYRESVVDFEVIGGICGLNLFDEINREFEKAERIWINQQDVNFHQPTLFFQFFLICFKFLILFMTFYWWISFIFDFLVFFMFTKTEISIKDFF